LIRNGKNIIVKRKAGALCPKKMKIPLPPMTTERGSMFAKMALTSFLEESLSK
jgi:hypothetical protein